MVYYSDCYTAKYAAADGRVLWEQSYNGPGDGFDMARAVTADATGNVFMTGESYGGLSQADFYTAKYAAADGALLWQQRFEGSADYESSGRAVALDRVGNVVVTGGDSIGDYTAKYAATGELLWEQRFKRPQDDVGGEGWAVLTDRQGDVFVTGGRFVAKYAAEDGAIVWATRLEGAGRDMKLDANGNVVVTGRFQGSGWGSEYYTAKLSSDGRLLWEGRHRGSASFSYNEASGIVIDGDGDVIVTGTTYTGPQGEMVGDFYTAKYAAADGALLWDRRSGGHHSGGKAMTLDADGNVLVAGYIDGEGAPNSDSDYYTAKYASIDGAVLWEKRFAGSGGTYVYPSGLAVGPGGVVAS